MNTPTELTVKLFGAFRQYHQGPLRIEVPTDSTVLAVKVAIAQALQQSNASFTNLALVNQSAIADDHRIYRNDERVPNHACLAILPPVCGG